MSRAFPVAAAAAFSMILGCSGGPPSNLGVSDGKLAPCPGSPNCVSTQASDPRAAIEALPFRGSPTETMRALLEVVDRMARTTVITRSENYLHVEYRTRMGFVDDVEFYLDTESGTVQFRSASRLGYSDMGVNRRRMEELRSLYLALP